MGGRLAGRRIVITRARAQGGRLRDLLAAEGAEVLELPLIEVSEAGRSAELDEILEQPAQYDWIVFTSTNGVKYFLDALVAACGDIRAIGFARLACVGEATAKAIRAYHLRVDLLPEEATARALGHALVRTGSLDSAKVLVVTGNRNDPELPQMLLGAGHAIVDEVAVYETTNPDLSGTPEAEDFRRDGADAILFTSASTVEGFLRQGESLAIREGGRKPRVFSIGPSTSEAVRKAGIPLAAEAGEPSLPALVECLLREMGDPTGDS